MVPMTRAGREPTEDAKRRIVTACREVGLKVLSAKMYLRHDQGDRVIHVCASAPERPFEQASISIMTAVTLKGDWSRLLDIKCAACEKDTDPPRVWDVPVLRGREAVPLEELVEALKKTAKEQEQVVAAMKLSIDGPYTFDDTSWETPPDLVEWP